MSTKKDHLRSFMSKDNITFYDNKNLNNKRDLSPPAIPLDTPLAVISPPVSENIMDTTIIAISQVTPKTATAVDGEVSCFIEVTFFHCKFIITLGGLNLSTPLTYLF